MFVLVEMQVAFALFFAGAEKSVGGGELGHQESAAGCFMLENR